MSERDERFFYFSTLYLLHNNFRYCDLIEELGNRFWVITGHEQYHQNAMAALPFILAVK